MISPRAQRALPAGALRQGANVWLLPGPVWEHRLLSNRRWQGIVIGEPAALKEDWEEVVTALGQGDHAVLDCVEGVHSGVFWRRGDAAHGWWRDRFGRIPWQHSTSPTLLASTDPDLLQHVRPAGEPNLDRLADFLAGGRADDRADFTRGLERLRPGEVARRGAHGTIEVRAWWRARPPLTAPRPAPTLERREEVASRLGARLKRGATVLAEAGAWLALSGGLDSATLLGLSPQPAATRTLTLALDPEERERARRLAEALNARWKPLAIDARWPLRLPAHHLCAPGWGPHAHPDLGWFPDALNELRATLEEPLSTLVTGHGADDALWIPPRHWLNDRLEHLALGELLAARRALGSGELLAPALSATLDALGLRALREHHRHVAAVSPEWLLATPQAGPTPDLPAGLRFAHFRAGRLLSWNWEMIMRSLARIARRSRLRLVTPFLDAQFWALSLELTPAELVEGGRQKAPLRRLCHRLPAEVRQRPKHGSFDALVERGLALHEFNRALRLMPHSQLVRHRVIDAARFQHALASYLARPETGLPWRGSWEIWRTLAAELWLQNPGRPEASATP